MKSNSEEILCAEIGLFVIEFEGLLQTTKDTIQNYFREEKLIDTIPVEILMFDSSSASIAKYFGAISLHCLNMKHADKNVENVKKLKKYVNLISNHLLKAGELRNDVVHATWYLSSIYGTDAQLEANRIKVTANGVVMRKLSVQPNILDKSISMIYSLSYFIQAIGDIIADKSFPVENHIIPEDSITSFNNIDFEGERNKLFLDDLQHFENVMKERRELDELFKKDDGTA